MHLVGIERNESPRADAQLAGRVARQGDPGSCQFFVSSDDAVLQRFAPQLAREMTRMPNRDGEILADLSTRIAQAQHAAETACALQRKRVRAQDLSLSETIGRLYHVS